MERCRHFIEREIYLVSNSAVSGNDLFVEKADQLDFEGKLDRFLSPVCNVLGFKLERNRFDLIVELKSRSTFIRFFRNKKQDESSEDLFIPCSSHIFSRQMSNLQVSVAKSTNKKYGRNGALFGARFERFKIENGEDLRHLIEEFKQSGSKPTGSEEWIEQIKRPFVSSISSVKEYVQRIEMESVGNTGVEGEIINNLGGYLSSTSKTDLIPRNLRKMMQSFRRKHPCGPNFN